MAKNSIFGESLVFKGLTPTEHFLQFPDSWQVPIYTRVDKGTVKGATCTVYKVLYDWPNETIKKLTIG